MHRYALAPSLLSLLIVLFGCSEPKIEGDTTKKVFQSYLEVKKSLPEKERGEFRKDLNTVLMPDAGSLENIGEILGGMASAEGSTLKEKGAHAIIKTSDRVDVIRGKTAGDIRKMADSIEVENLNQRISEIQTTVEDLRENKRKAKRSENQLAKLDVTARLFEDDNRFIDSNNITFRIQNNVEKSIRVVKVSCKYQNPSEEVVYGDDEYRLELNETISTGEDYFFQGRLNITDELYNQTIYSGASLNCEPVAVWGPSSADAIYDASFGEDEKEELKELEKELEAKKAELQRLSR